MKNVSVFFSALILAGTTSALAAPAFVPTGKIISSPQNAYDIADNTFPSAMMSYSTVFPSFIPANTASLYAITANSDNNPPSVSPKVGDTNIVTYRSENNMAACTFQFVYEGNSKFEITSLTNNSQCLVKNGTDLVLP